MVLDSPVNQRRTWFSVLVLIWYAPSCACPWHPSHCWSHRPHNGHSWQWRSAVLKCRIEISKINSTVYKTFLCRWISFLLTSRGSLYACRRACISLPACVSNVRVQFYIHSIFTRNYSQSIIVFCPRASLSLQIQHSPLYHSSQPFI